MRLRPLMLAMLAAWAAAAPAAGPRKAVRPNADGIAARHLARLRLVFREAYAPDVAFNLAGSLVEPPAR